MKKSLCLLYSFFISLCLFSSSEEKHKEVTWEWPFGTYTGCWYSSYYELGVNWASKEYDASRYFSWATPDYKNYGYEAYWIFI